MLLADYCNNGQDVGTCGVWKTADGGRTWALKQHADFPTDVAIDGQHPERAYLSGGRSAEIWGISKPGEWGYGGGMYSNDGGETWQEDAGNPMQAKMHSVASDPSRPCQLWYATAGGGVLLGPAPPAGLEGC